MSLGIKNIAENGLSKMNYEMMAFAVDSPVLLTSRLAVQIHI